MDPTYYKINKSRCFQVEIIIQQNVPKSWEIIRFPRKPPLQGVSHAKVKLSP
jgi:hypothetical protein